MKNSLFLIFIWVLSSAMAQEPGARNGFAPKGKIVGKVLDAETNEPLEFTTISLLDRKDSSIVTGTITDEKGKYVLEADYGLYLVKFEFISYEIKYINEVTLNRENEFVDLGTISLAISSTMLDEIEVVAERSEMQFSLDKRVFNVGRDLANKGGSAEDILDNIPSVEVDVEGNVSLRGSENVRILVDGKPSGLIGIGDSGGLKSLPAGMIESVEIVTNASARYEAEGTAGIINIILKKDRQHGVNGSFDVSAGIPYNYGASANINVRKDWINFFVNYGFRYRENPGQGFTYQEFFNGKDIPISNQIRSGTRGGASNSLRGGMDLILSEKDVITGAILYRYGNNFGDSRVEYQDFDTQRILQNVTYRLEDQIEKEPNLEYELNYERKFERKDQKFTAQMQYQNNRENQSSDYTEYYFDGQLNELNIPNLLQRSNNQERQRDILFKSDYVQPFGKDKKFEVGTRISLRDINNDYLVEEQKEDVWSNLINFSNNFNYSEDIVAAYGIYASKIDKWSYQLGLRAEYSHVITELEETHEVNDRSYTNLFPTAHLTYEVNEGNAIQASYSRRISRPRFWYLNPFFTFSNARSLFGGNPNLDPELTDSYELGYLKYWENVNLGTSIYYRHTTGDIQRITRVVGDGITRTQPENLAIEDAVGIELTLGADLKKWWRIDANGNVYYAVIEGALGDQIFNRDTYTFTNRLSSKMKFWKDAEFQIRFSYRAPRNTAQGRSKSIYSTDLAFSKDVLKRNGTITVSGRDIFNTRKYRSEVFDDFFYSESEYQHRSRFVVFSFNYRLNQKKRRQRGGDEDREGGEEMF